MSMTSSVPYLLRGMHEWILDNGCTPYLVLDATVDGTFVPEEYVKEGQIVLNISPSAVRDLQIEQDFLSFDGRFQGVAMEIYAPINAVLGIVARENGEGMWFPKEDDDNPDPTPPSTPTLKVVK
jgi:stringent starvation protein B